MQISSGTLYRSIVGNSDLSFLFEATFDNVSGESSIGFSGLSGKKIELFNFKSGKIFDNNSEYVWSYNPRESISISGNIGSGYLNYFIQNNPICLYSPHGFNYYDNFYITTNKSTVDFNCSIQGIFPNFNIQFPLLVDYGSPITGYIYNESSPHEKTFKVYSGNLFNSDSLYRLNTSILPQKVFGNAYGRLDLNFTPNEFLNRVNFLNPTLTLFTNFGQIVQELNFEFTNKPIYFINFVTGFTGITGSNVTDSGYYYNFQLQSIFYKNEPITFKLGILSGNTGEKLFSNFTASGIVSGGVSGFIHGFDFITGTVFGNGISQEKNYYGNFASGKFEESPVRQFRYATGKINYHYTLNFTGGSGTGLSPKNTTILASGFVTGIGTGFIFRSKRFDVTRTGRLTGLWNNSRNVRTGVIKYSKEVYYTGIYDINYLDYLWSSDNVSGENISGSYDKIYYVYGNRRGLITESESGRQIINEILYSDQLEAIALENIIPQDLNILYSNNSGSVFASENPSGAREIFVETSGRSIGSQSYWYTTLETGMVGFSFNNITPIEKATFYKISSNYDSSLYPFAFSLEGSNDFENWTILDCRHNELFYPTPQKIYEIPNPGVYQHIRLNVYGKPWLHKDFNSGVEEKINITELLLYKHIPIKRIPNYPELVPHLTGYRSIPSGDVIYSADEDPYFAWKAFDKEKTEGYAKILAQLDTQTNQTGSYLGFQLLNEIPNRITGFYIEFEQNYWPKFLSVESKFLDADPYIEFYRKESNIQRVESSLFKTPVDQKYVRFNFIDNSNTSITRFYPSLGNHDYDDPGGFGEGYLQFFNNLNYIQNNSSNNKKYYDIIIGPCHFFILDSDPVTGGTSRCGIISEGAGKGDGPNSTANEYYKERQMAWFNNAISTSTLEYKFVIFHHPPYTSEIVHYGYHKLSYEEGWRLDLATAVFNGHSHNYERFQKTHDENIVHYFVNGSAGINLRGFGTPLPDSIKRLREYGWTKIEIYSHGFKIAFVSQFNNNEKDTLIVGDIFGPVIYKFAIIADYGVNGSLDITNVPPNYNDPNNNFYTYWVSRSIHREPGVTAVFSAGDNSYPNSTLSLLDLNCGRFYCNYIGQHYNGNYCKESSSSSQLYFSSSSSFRISSSSSSSSSYILNCSSSSSSFSSSSSSSISSSSSSRFCQPPLSSSSSSDINISSSSSSRFSSSSSRSSSSSNSSSSSRSSSSSSSSRSSSSSFSSSSSSSNIFISSSSSSSSFSSSSSSFSSSSSYSSSSSSNGISSSSSSSSLLSIVQLSKAFIPVIGDDDYKNNNQYSNDFETYFPVMGNKILENTSNKNKYYDFYINNSHFIVLDTDPICGGVFSDGNSNNLAGIGESGIANTIYENQQRSWFNNTITTSTGKYKFVFTSRPPITTTSYNLDEVGMGPYGFIYYKGSTKFNPFNGWKLHLADAVYAGFSRKYERIEFDTTGTTLLGQQGQITSTGLPPHLQITRNGNILKIDYGISGYDPSYGSIAMSPAGNARFMTHNYAISGIETAPPCRFGCIVTGDGSKFTSMNVFIKTGLNAGFNSFLMTSSGSGFTHNYTLPNNIDYINLYFVNNSNGRTDNNSYDYDAYNYIYYLNNDNNFGRTKYFNVGNVLKQNQLISVFHPNQKEVTSYFGFLQTRVFRSGIQYISYAYYPGYTDPVTLKPLLDIIDITAVGNINGPMQAEFATISNFGMTYGPDGAYFNINQNGVSQNEGNGYISVISEDIKNKNIDYVFALGNMNYHPTGMFYTGAVGGSYRTLYPPSYLFDRTSGLSGLSPINSSFAPYNIDQSVGAYFFDYIPCYRGAYTGIAKSGLYNDYGGTQQLWGINYKTLFDAQKAVSGIINLSTGCINSKFKFNFNERMFSSSSSLSSSSSSSSFRLLSSLFMTSGINPENTCLSEDINNYTTYYIEGNFGSGSYLYKDLNGTIFVDNAWYATYIGGGLENKRLIQTSNGLILNNSISCSDVISSSSSSSSRSSSSSSSSLSSSSSSSSGVFSSSSSSSVIIPLDFEWIQVINPT